MKKVIESPIEKTHTTEYVEWKTEEQISAFRQSNHRIEDSLRCASTAGFESIPSVLFILFIEIVVR